MKNNNNSMKNDKGSALLKLGMWFAFMIVLIVFFGFKETDSEIFEDEDQQETITDQVEEKFLTYDEMQHNLLNNNYEFVYNIKTTELNYIFTGTKCNNNYTVFKENGDTITKYNYKSNEIPNDIYENIDSNFLNIDVLFENLKNYLYKIEKNGDTRNITYDKDGYQVIVKTNLENITNINIINEDIFYNLEFMNIGTCGNIK